MSAALDKLLLIISNAFGYAFCRYDNTFVLLFLVLFFMKVLWIRTKEGDHNILLGEVILMWRIFYN